MIMDFPFNKVSKVQKVNIKMKYSLKCQQENSRITGQILVHVFRVSKTSGDKSLTPYFIIL